MRKLKERKLWLSETTAAYRWTALRHAPMSLQKSQNIFTLKSHPFLLPAAHSARKRANPSVI
jgi:hypothetical protein